MIPSIVPIVIRCSFWFSKNADGSASLLQNTSSPEPPSILSSSATSLLNLPRTTPKSPISSLPKSTEKARFKEAAVLALGWYADHPESRAPWNWNNFDDWGASFEQLHEKAFSTVLCAKLKNTQQRFTELARNIRDVVVLFVIAPLIPVFALFPAISLTRLILVLVLPMALVLLRQYWLPTVVTLLQPLSDRILAYVGYTAERYSTLCLEPGSHRIVPCPTEIMRPAG